MRGGPGSQYRVGQWWKKWLSIYLDDPQVVLSFRGSLLIGPEKMAPLGQFCRALGVIEEWVSLVPTTPALTMV